MLTASIICREALCCFTNELRCATDHKVPEPPHLDMTPSPRPGVHYTNIAVGDEELERELDYLAGRYIYPCMVLFARRLRNVNLSLEFMECPKQYQTANERFHNVAMRVVINDTMPIGRQIGLKAKRKEYYDIADDALKTGLCTNVILFTVCERGYTHYIPTA